MLCPVRLRSVHNGTRAWTAFAAATAMRTAKEADLPLSGKHLNKVEDAQELYVEQRDR